jgi:branched-chain amino acid transport system substrate-binding protein
VVKAQGAAAEGIKGTLHYATTLDNPANTAFRAAYHKAYDRDADVFAVQGYDTGSLLVQAAEAVKGDTAATADMIAALDNADLSDSPRGPWRMSEAHNPVQDIYLRQVKDGRNQVIGIASKALADPATGCKLG